MPDEVLSNILTHGYDDTEGHQVTLEFDLSSDRIDLVVADYGREFDPLSQSAPAITGSLEDYEISGVGIKVLRRLTDEASYRRVADQNILTLSFFVNSADGPD